ncbi:phospholipid-transporting ATPase ABCA3-like isoform X2 [Apostichopus japonicus]|uniref:phospholipid-transporting ATPase ABCA3-like isoform X2 n=1 Tax=Stichopus japonicus TaxID=307972 RepID=UPI003AB11AC9
MEHRSAVFSIINQYSPLRHSTLGRNTKLVCSPLLICFPCCVTQPWGGTPNYMEEGFLPLQHALDKAIMQCNDISTDGFEVEMQRYPYPPYNDDLFLIAIQTQLPLIILLSLVYPILNIARSLVYEKEKRLKESMKMMGLHNWLHWTAWFFRYWLQLTLSVLVMTVLFSISLGDQGAVLKNSDPVLIFIYLELYAMASISLAFLLSTFFKKANSSTAGSGVIWFLTYSPFFFLSPRYSSLSRGVKMVTCLLSNDAMAFGSYLISMYEGTAAGITFDNFYQPVSDDDNLSMLDIYIMLFIDTIFYLTLTWYIEAVFPGEFGIPRPWYFPLSKSYWCGHIMEDENDEETEASPLLRPCDSDSSDFMENEPVGMHAGIRIQNLRKVYKGNNVAVNNMCLNMYEGQITALLGHNGAGKTTTLSMLTGLFPPSKGTAIVNGHDIRTDIDGVHTQLGLCPQHDVLYDNLTVEEHLYFFAKLKGYPSDKVALEIDFYIKSLQLEDKRHVPIKALSGGMKRKLSVGIALIADSKIIMLDEPTSGMDPSARRFTWDILQKHRKGRTILLTTHYMDEADLLGDRIAIMADGQLQCVGSSLFLKRKYGVGYHMSIAKAPDCPVAEVASLVKRHVPSSVLENNVGAELSFILPQEEVGKFEALFDEMEKKKIELGIDSYGASVTTMEEVFIKVGDGNRDTKALPDGYGSSTENQAIENRQSAANGSMSYQEEDLEEQTNHLYEENPIRNTGLMLYCQQFRALFIKRFLHSLRNWLLMIFQLLIPIQCTLVSLLAAIMFPAVSNSPPLSMNISVYGDTYIPYQVTNSSTAIGLGEVYASQFNGTRTGTEFVNTSYPDLSMADFLLDRNENTTVSFNFDNLMASTFNLATGEADKIMSVAHFNNQPYHSAPMSLSAVDNAFLKYYSNDKFSVHTINHPLPRTVKEQASDQVNKGVQTGFAIAYNMLFGMSFLAASFVVFLIKENTTKSKHLQFISGVRSSNFWLSAYTWDLLNYTIPCVLSCALFAAFNVEAFSDDGRFLYIFLLLFLHGWAIIPLMYLASFLFTVPSTGFVTMTMFNVVFGSTTFLAVEVLLVPELNLVNVGHILDWVFVFSPSYLLGKAMADFYNNFQILSVCDSSPLAKKFCEENEDLKFQENYLAWEYPGIGRSVVFLFAEGFIYFGIVLLVEMGVFRKMKYLWKGRKNKKPSQYEPVNNAEEEDEDVRTEREQIERSPLERLSRSFVLVLKGLRKVYPGRGGRAPVVAVEGSTLGVPSKECFGLLGVNGAGKTTTFKMLTGDEALSEGDAYVEGFSVKSDTRKVQQRIGYCPQFDGLVDQLTGRETLFMYARLRGVPEKRIALKVDCLLRVFNMEEHADKQAKAYSGGNKRKLSTAVALIGDPPLVLLDEPTTGMDPVTRRLLWKALCEIRNAGRSIVLTSHSMEECEALCTRLAIMVNGIVKCLGSTQHLKSRFGEGFTLLIKASPGPDGQPRDMQHIKDFITREFRGCQLKDEHQGMVHYHITDTSIAWATIFGTLERAKDQYGIQDYSVSQTSLEQVFLNFARMQREEDEAPIA